MDERKVTIVCSECGHRAIITNGVIPDGQCQFCNNAKFGWIAYPQVLEDRQFCMEDGDIIVVNTALPKDSQRRIFSIERKGEMVYLEGGK